MKNKSAFINKCSGYNSAKKDLFMTIYLDYNATAPVREGAIRAVTDSLSAVGNPSSVHYHGRDVRKTVEQTRETLAHHLGFNPIDITFTSGATEANNMVILGHPANTLVVSATEHPSVIQSAQNSGKKVVILPVDENGVLDCTVLEKILRGTAEKALVSIMAVNNETGVIQPMLDIATLCRQYGAEFHCDAVQAPGKLDMAEPAKLADYLILSAHKIGGPMGVGALIYNHHHVLTKVFYGGGQERRRRSGTENVPGIIGFAAAVKQAELERAEKNALWLKWQKTLEEHIHRTTPHAIIVGQAVQRVTQTIQVVLPDVPAQKQLMFMDINGISVSSGSACSSGSVQPSHVLLAQGYGDRANNALRLSWGHATTQEDMDNFMTVWDKMADNFYKK